MTTDAERAEAFLDFWPPDPFIANRAEACPALIAVLTAVRLDERSRIVQELRRRGTSRHESFAGAAALHHAADDIENAGLDS